MVQLCRLKDSWWLNINQLSAVKISTNNKFINKQLETDTSKGILLQITNTCLINTDIRKCILIKSQVICHLKTQKEILQN